MIKFLTPTEDDLGFLAATMRPEDREELRLASGKDALSVLKLSVGASFWARVAVDNSVPFCIFGLGRHGSLSSKGHPWMLGSVEIRHHKREVLTFSRPMVEHMRQGVSELENWVWSGNIDHVRWLRFCGFTVEEPAPWGVSGAAFHRFHMKGDVCATR